MCVSLLVIVVKLQLSEDWTWNELLLSFYLWRIVLGLHVVDVMILSKVEMLHRLHNANTIQISMMFCFVWMFYLILWSPECFGLRKDRTSDHSFAGRVVEEKQSLMELGIRPHSSTQMEMSSSDPTSYPLRLLRPPEHDSMPDVITVRVQKGMASNVISNNLNPTLKTWINQSWYWKLK